MLAAHLSKAIDYSRVTRDDPRTIHHEQLVLLAIMQDHRLRLTLAMEQLPAVTDGLEQLRRDTVRADLEQQLGLRDAERYAGQHHNAHLLAMLPPGERETLRIDV